MSKYVKNLITDHLREQLNGVDAALLVNMVGMDANANNSLRAEMADKGIEVLVVKNSLAARATAGTSLDGLFHGVMEKRRGIHTVGIPTRQRSRKVGIGEPVFDQFGDFASLDAESSAMVKRVLAAAQTPGQLIQEPCARPNVEGYNPPG